MKETFKSSLYLLLRLLMISLLSFMSIPLWGKSVEILGPILAVFYFIILMYFFVFTMWSVGRKDVIKVNSGNMKINKLKGFIAGGFVLIPTVIFYFLPEFFPKETTNAVVRLILNMLKLFFTMSCTFAMDFASPRNAATSGTPYHPVSIWGKP